MSEQKNYTKYTFEKGEKVEVSKNVHYNIKKAFEILWGNYEEEKPGSYSHNATIMASYLFMHKSDVEDKVFVEADAFEKVRNFVRKLLDKETRVMSDIKFDILNLKTDKFVKSKRKGGEYKDIFSPDKTLDREGNRPKQYITPNGQTLLNISQELDSIFIANIDLGKGITFEELSEKNNSGAEQADVNEPKMEVVDADR